jgi:CRP-like cAMP-binding protein
MDDEVTGKLDGYFAKYKPLSFKKGATIINLADEPSGVFYLKEGYVKMSTILDNGNELTLNIYKPGAFFPMFWALGGVPNNYAFVAMTAVVLHRASRTEITDFLKENSEVTFDLSRRILSGMDGLITNFRHLLVGSADTRVASALVIAAKRFGKPNAEGYTEISLNLTHQDIANLAGISRETASIAIGKLVKEKILGQVKRKFVVYDLDALFDETAFDGESLTSQTII